MFGWYYNENTNTLNRYYDSELISTIQYDDEEKLYVLFSRCNHLNLMNNFEFVEAYKEDMGFSKLIILEEINISKIISNKMGCFYIDKNSLSKCKNNFFKIK